MLYNSFITRINNCYYQEHAIDMTVDRSMENSVEKNSVGRLQGLILFWTCGYCENSNVEPLVRKDAVSGEKKRICLNCKGESCVTFSPSKIMSEREKIVQHALSFIPSHHHKEILEDLAWVEALFVFRDTEDIAKGYWDDLKGEINHLVQQDQKK